MSIIATAFGSYPGTPNPRDYDIVIGHSFGTSTEPGSINHQTALATVAFTRDETPIAVDRTLANAFTKNMRQPDHVVEGEISNGVGQGVGAWGTLIDTRDTFMRPNSLRYALQVAQVNFIGRVLMQSEKAGIPSAAPTSELLPHGFDRRSAQVWTRALAFWVPREVAGSLVLRKQGKL